MHLMWKGFIVGLVISIPIAFFFSVFLVRHSFYEILRFIPLILTIALVGGGVGALIGWIKEEKTARSLVLVGVGLAISLLSGQIIFTNEYPLRLSIELFSFAHLFGVILLAYGISLSLQVKVFKKEDIERLDQGTKIAIPTLIFCLLSFMSFGLLKGKHVPTSFLGVPVMTAMTGTWELLLKPEHIGIGAVIFIATFVVANLTCHFVSCSIGGKRGILVGIMIGFFVYTYTLIVITKSLEILEFFEFSYF
jgi:hypothetical protein